MGKQEKTRSQKVGVTFLASPLLSDRKSVV